MLVQIDLRSRTPIFEQIKNQVTELAVSGVLAPHDPIPSIRALAQELKLNFNTVKRAYSELEQAGVIYSLQGRGSYIAETAAANAHLKAKALNQLDISLKIGKANGISLETVLEAVNRVYGKDQEAQHD